MVGALMYVMPASRSRMAAKARLTSPGVERGGEAVVDGVGDLDGFFKCGELEERDDGAEDLFAGDAHLGCDSGQDGGLEESSVGVGAGGERVAAAEKLCAFALRDFDVTLRSFNLGGVDLRTDFDGFLESVAEFERAWRERRTLR